MNDIRYSQAINKQHRTIIPRTRYYCGNCGKHGHTYRHCKEPPTSFGIILVNIKKNSDNDNVIDNFLNDTDTHDIYSGSNGILYSNSDRMLEVFCRYKNNIRFLMIKRKHSLGFIEFVRGRYDIRNIEGIQYLFTQMMKEEIGKVNTMEFDEIWKDLWSSDTPPINVEYERSKYKFHKLKHGIDTDLDLDYYAQNIPPVWHHTEWGFPKGRRNGKEADIECAKREFNEETGYTERDYSIVETIPPIVENLTGTNGKEYKHVYYVAISNKKEDDVTLDPNNVYQVHEIGDIGWFTYENVMKFVRPYHKDRKKIISHLYMFLINHIITDKIGS